MVLCPKRFASHDPRGSRTMTLSVKKTPALPRKCTFMNRVTHVAYLNGCRSVGGRSARYPFARRWSGRNAGC